MVLFSCWLDLANDKIFSAIDCGVLFFRSLVPQWIMIRSGLFLSVGLIYDSISSVFAPGKDLTKNKSSLVDNSQPLTFLTMESPTTTVTLRPFPFLFLFCFYAYVDLFYMLLFPRFTCFDKMRPVTLLDNLSVSLLHPFVSVSSEGLFIWDETPHLGETSHLSEVLYFIPRFYDKNIPPEWDTFHPS